MYLYRLYYVYLFIHLFDFCSYFSDRPSVIRLGEVDFDDPDESQAFDYRVAGIQVHEGYVLPEKYNDIAIITLRDRVSHN